MSGFFGEDEFQCDLEDAVCAATYAEGLGSLGITSAQRMQAENRQWKAINAMKQYAPQQSGLSRPGFSVQAGGSDKVKGEDGQWRQATEGEKSSMRQGTFDPKKTAQGRYETEGGRQITGGQSGTFQTGQAQRAIDKQFAESRATSNFQGEQFAKGKPFFPSPPATFKSQGNRMFGLLGFI